MLARHTLCQCFLPLSIAAVCAVIGLGLSATDSFPAPLAQQAPSKPPKGYLPIIPCQSELGQVWASPNASRPPGGNTPPLLGFYEGHLTGMVFYLSEKHLYPLLPQGGRWSFTGTINATVDSITLTPAQLRPNRDKRAYELTFLIHHEPPLTVTCATGNTPATKQGQIGPNSDAPGVFGGGGGGGGGKRPKK
jgi:hypothetical protein